MKGYVSPSCTVDLLEQESSFLTGASSEGYPVTPVNPFGTNSSTMGEEDDYDD